MFVLCFTRPRYQVSVYRTIGPLVINELHLGISVSEHLDYKITTKFVAHCAGRALGLLIAKSKSFDGLPYVMYTPNCTIRICVVPVISYGE